MKYLNKDICVETKIMFLFQFIRNLYAAIYFAYVSLLLNVLFNKKENPDKIKLYKYL